MKIFLAGATGVIGQRLVPLLVSAGHEVGAMTRSGGRVDDIRAWGAEPIVCDVYDTNALTSAVTAFRPDLVMDQLTDLPDHEADIPASGGANARIRREGTANLLAATRAAEVDRLISQSVAWPLEGDSGKAAEDHERMVLAAGGVIIRYGRFYGPGTYYPAEFPETPRIQIDEAARRTVDALDADPGVIVITEG